MRTAMLSISVIVALVWIASSAHAAPRVVVLDFDGPAPQSSDARAQLLALLAERYTIVATKTWTEARERATGASRFRTAAKRTRVDAIIEGWFDHEPSPTLTLAVRNALTGKELAQLEAPVNDMVLTVAIGESLVARLVTVLDTLEGERVTEPAPVLAQAAVAVPPQADDADRDSGNVLAAIFQPPPAYTEEQQIVLGVRRRVPAPRIQLSAGPYLQSRGMAWAANPDSSGTPPEYPASSLYGFAAKLAVYPLPARDVGGRLSGPGVMLDVAHSIASSLTVIDDQGVTGDYTLTHTSWEAGAHWRWPLDLASIDLGFGYGQTSHALVDQFPESVAIPNTDYRYVAGGARVDLAVTDRASVGAGARYLYLLDAGQVSEEMWYGAGMASGLVLDGQAIIPLPHRMFVMAGIEYRRIAIDFDGSGVLTNDWGLSDVLDSAITGTAQIGISL